VRLGCLGKPQVVACVRPAGCFEFALPVQLFQPELADGLQHDEAQFFPLVRRLLQQALIEEGRDPLKDTEGLVAVLLAYHFGGLERTAAHEDGEPAEEALLLLAQQGIRPLESVAQRLLAGGQIACATCQHGEPMLQSFEQSLRRQQLAAGSGQFDRQRQAIQAHADICDGVRIGLCQLKGRLDGLRTQDKETYRR
jgi:hypothetical protein